MSKVYLFPTLISDQTAEEVLPSAMLNYIHEVTHLVTENIKTTRRYLRTIGFEKNFDDIPYFILDKRTTFEEVGAFWESLEPMSVVGLFSEAGIPCIADPGSLLVKVAHKNSAVVKPFSGPSSIFMALSASGFNGQNFAFNGYLPIKDPEKSMAIRRMEQRIYAEDQTQIFIEAPYRNNQLLKTLIAVCKSDTFLSVASEISSPQEFIMSQSIRDWGGCSIDLNKKNTVFLLYK